eukprot:CAMPEP_0175431684 /NCGR_PEP_ID=MMETSP0095-20121207/52499_1 /TAXON_ID=311494 /ORGANISM="Alexandrium monilatum, Strain CCMP3105" /LENGTH=630 /DNA_ID=CAMNT_0016731169 /DNA_START=55 /DNA_END=1947 /DNA_ORIENTATION=-
MGLARAFHRGCFSLLLGLSLAPPVLAGDAALPGAYMTSEKETRTFAWGSANRTFTEALADAFLGESDSTWVDISFTDSGVTVTRASLAEWVEKDLLGGPDPFAAHDGKVPVPWPNMDGLQDQLGPDQWVSYSRRQVCYIVAKSLVGAGTEGYANGLLRYLDKVANSGCQARKGAFGRAYLVLLAACAADPALANGGQGPLLVAAKASAQPEVETVRAESRQGKMASAGLRVCQYDDGVGGHTEFPEGAERVPREGCSPPSAEGPGRDFMTGGLKGQAAQDISASFLGGYVFGYDCGLGGGQDERLMTYMPEVGALTFFLSQSTYRGGDEHPHPQLRQPAWILGARQLFIGLDGTGRFTAMLERDPAAPLTSDLVGVELLGRRYQISSSRPFLAFMSENQGFIPEGNGTEDTRMARKNQHPAQRTVNVSTGFAFANQVRAWYYSVALHSYSRDVRPMLQTLVQSLGTGPWLAGLWWGDSQLGLLSVWLGHALAAPSWVRKQDGGNGAPALRLDYYLYSAFTENPGNQCLVHSGASCKACLDHCKEKPLPKSAYWLPAWAFFGDEEELSSSCIPTETPCGKLGLQDVIAAYAGSSVERLWSDVEKALESSVGSTASSVFDLLLGSSSRRLMV